MVGRGLVHRLESCDFAGRIRGGENAEESESPLPADRYVSGDNAGCIDTAAVEPSRSSKYNWCGDGGVNRPSDRGRCLDGRGWPLVFERQLILLVRTNP